MRQTQVVVNRRAAERFRNGHLWIYRSDLVKIKASAGAVVSVFDEREKFLGKAFYSDKSEIALRLISTRDEKIDKEFWRKKILAAKRRREMSNLERTNAQRLVYSEGDLLPSLIIDVYSDVYVIQTLSQGSDRLKETFAEILREEFAPGAIVERNDVRIREFEELPLQAGVLYGECPEEIEIEQDGVKFYVAPLGGQKTGTFLDQRENRFALRKYASGRALDCFTFNGGFALNLAQTCESVLAVDISEDATRLAGRNAELNKITNVEFKTANVFDFLRELETAGETFDTIVLDPPAFTKSRSAIKAAARGYKEINLRALKLLANGGILATCSCSFHMSEAHFLEIIEEAARDAGKRVQLLEKRAQSSDHPVLLNMPETHYLKCLILRVLN